MLIKAGTKKTTISRQLVELSVKTAMLAATPAPRGKPSGPGLYHVKGLKLPNYIEQIRDALMKGGMTEGHATATAIVSCKKWSRGGGNVTPEVQAAATAALAELKAAQVEAHSHSNPIARSRIKDFAQSNESIGNKKVTSGRPAGKANKSPQDNVKERTEADTKQMSNEVDSGPDIEAHNAKLQADRLKAAQLKQEAARVQLQLNGLKALMTQQMLSKKDGDSGKVADSPPRLKKKKNTDLVSNTDQYNKLLVKYHELIAKSTALSQQTFIPAPPKPGEQPAPPPQSQPPSGGQPT